MLKSENSLINLPVRIVTERGIIIQRPIKSRAEDTEIFTTLGDLINLITTDGRSRMY